MRLVFAFLALAVSCLLPVQASAPATATLELSVTGLNCSLCGPAMKAALLKAAPALDLEARLECGRIYLSHERLRAPNEGALSLALMANGFTLNGTREVPQTLAQVRQSSEVC